MTDTWNHLDELGRPEWRWSAGFLLVAGLFTGGAWLAIHWTPEIAPPSALPPAAVMIDLAPLPVAPVTPPTQTPPGPQQTLSEPPPEPTPQPKVTLPTTPAPDVTIPLPPPTPPKPPVQHRLRPRVHRPPTPHPDRMPPAPITTAPPQMQAPPAPSEASPALAPSQAPPSNAVPTWQGELLGRLEQFKRYPPGAQEQGEQGTAFLHFTMDRNGKVLSASIAKSSGHSDLDQETLALIQRAQPLPKPPPEVPGDPITLTVPVQFFLRTGD